MIDLLHARCQGHGAESMGEGDIRNHLGQVSGWHLVDRAIEKTFSFRNYYETIAFVNALAWICHAEDHHPELRVTFDRCVVRFSTHSVGGISRRHEFEADAYARTHADGNALAAALLKLHEDNAATLTPDPWYARFYYSHPPATERLAALAAGHLS